MGDGKTKVDPQISYSENGTTATTTAITVEVADADLDPKGSLKPQERENCGVSVISLKDDNVPLEGIEPKPTGTQAIGSDAIIKKEVEGMTKRQAPPDGGYGWFIVLGCFIVNIIIGGLGRSAGNFFLVFEQKYNMSAQLTAWPGALASAFRSFLGPLASALSLRYGVRAVGMVGSIILFLALLLNGFAPNFFFLFFSHGFLQGLGSGLVYAPGMILVSMYFDKRRGLAMGITSSGAGVGTVALVPVTQMLFDNYGYTGAFMIIAAISLNAAVSAALYRPLRKSLQTPKPREGKDNEGFDGLDESKEGRHPAIITANALENGQNGGKKEEGTKDSNGCSKITVKNDTSPVPHKAGETQKPKKNMINFYLLKNPAFLMFCLSNISFTTAIKSAATFLLPLITSFGFTETDGAFVISVFGVADTIGRIAFGYLFDLGPFRPIRSSLYNGLIYCIAIVSFLLPLFRNYVALCFVCAVYGIFTGGQMSQKSTIAVDILGPDNIHSSIGLFIFFQTFGVLIGPPLAGALKDATGSFVPLFYMGGGLMVCAGSLMLASNVFLRRQRSREEEEAKKDLPTATTTSTENVPGRVTHM